MHDIELAGLQHGQALVAAGRDDFDIQSLCGEETGGLGEPPGQIAGGWIGDSDLHRVRLRERNRRQRAGQDQCGRSDACGSEYAATILHDVPSRWLSARQSRGVPYIPKLLTIVAPCR